MNYNKYLNSQEFVDNNAKRIPVCIVVDCSGSMKEYDNTSKTRIDRVNDGISLFYNEIRKNPKTKRAVDVLIIQVGNNATIINDFASTDVNPPKLRYLVEKNNLTAGINLALEKLDERKQIYKSANIDYYQPWLLIMSDGGVNNEFRKNLFDKVQEEVRDREINEKLSVFPIYVQGKPIWDRNKHKYVPIKPETYNQRLELMASFSKNKDRLINIDLANGKSFEDLFQFLHKSASSVANNKGIINDEKYGNFQQSYSVNNKIKPYKYKEIQRVDDVDETPKVDEFKVAEELKRKQQLEQEQIEQARKELLNNSYQEKQQIIVTKPIKNYIEMLINGTKAFPIKENKDGKIILTIQLKVNDSVAIVKNTSSTIFNDIFSADGKYEFTITDNSVEVNKKESSSDTNDKKERIKNMNKEIEDIICDISDWDKI